MPHTDTNISRDALRSYGMQPARRLSGERGNKENKGNKENMDPEGGAIRIYSDGEDGGFLINPAKVYVDVLAEFSREGFLRPCMITWEDGRAPRQPQGGRDGTDVYLHSRGAGGESFL